MSSQQLFAACQSGGVAEVTRLLDAGADVEYVDKDYRDFTPLMIAAWSGHSPVVKVLLQRGAEINAGDRGGSTALHQACFHGEADCVEALIEHGADINKQNDTGRTPLHGACRECKPGVVQLLLEAGARTDVRDKVGALPVDLVDDREGTQEIHRILKEAGSDPKPKAKAAASQPPKADSKSPDKEEVIEVKLPGTKMTKTESSIITERINEDTASLTCTLTNFMSMLEAGARTDVRDKHGRLPVDRVPDDREGTQEIHRILKEAGSDPKPKAKAAASQPPKADSKSPDKEEVIEVKLPGTKMTKTESSIITERINEDTASLTCTMTNFMSMLEKKINELMDQINKKNSKINDILREMQELKNLNSSLKSEVHKQSENLTTGVNHLISRSNEYYSSNCHQNHLSKVVFFKMFERIAEKIRYQQDEWQKCGRILFEKFPEGFVTQLLQDINLNYTTNKGCCLELLIQWKLYSYNKSDAEKMEELQAALRQVLSEAQAAELKRFMDSLLTQQQQKSQQQMQGSLTDKGLDTLAGQIGSEWHTLGLELEFSSPELIHLEEDFPAARRRNFQMLLSWRNRETGFPVMKLGRLAEALGRCGRGDLAKALK